MAPRVALGSDSRVTGERDLLDELRAAAALGAATADQLLRMVTTAAAAVLRLPSAGVIAEGQSADLLVLPRRGHTAAEALRNASRGDVALVAIGGRPLIGRARFAPWFAARRTPTHSIVVDGAETLAAASVAARIAASPIGEPGVEVQPLSTRRYAWLTS